MLLQITLLKSVVDLNTFKKSSQKQIANYELMLMVRIMHQKTVNFVEPVVVNPKKSDTDNSTSDGNMVEFFRGNYDNQSRDLWR